MRRAYGAFHPGADGCFEWTFAWTGGYSDRGCLLSGHRASKSATF
jgi:hypothetical protein